MHNLLCKGMRFIVLLLYIYSFHLLMIQQLQGLIDISEPHISMPAST